MSNTCRVHTTRDPLLGDTMKLKFGKGQRKPRPKKLENINGLEMKYARYLQARLMRGEILWWSFQGMTLKLATDTKYTPDFVVMLPDFSIELHETKGFWRDDAKVKIKVASELFPFKFIAITEKRKKDGGGWKFEEYGSTSWRFADFAPYEYGNKEAA